MSITFIRDNDEDIKAFQRIMEKIFKDYNGKDFIGIRLPNGRAFKIYEVKEFEVEEIEFI